MAIEDNFKLNGIKRVVIATCALGMGINFPRVHYVVQYSPPTSIVDLMLQAGRGGQDGSHAHCVTYFTKRQLSRCGKEVKSFLKSEECQRQALYSHFSESVTPLSPSHLCCSNCRLHCKCSTDHEKCEEVAEVFMTEADEQEEVQTELESEKTWTLANEDQIVLKGALMELQPRFSGNGNAFL